MPYKNGGQRNEVAKLLHTGRYAWYRGASEHYHGLTQTVPGPVAQCETNSGML